MALSVTEQQIYDLLERLQQHRLKASLEPILGLLDRLGNPHLRLPRTIHVAGTNGKGSVLAFLDSILREAGYNVHRYTSPHLVSICERIQVANHPITEKTFLHTLQKIAPHTSGLPLTFFDLITAVAFHEFARLSADYLLLETGLGGRYDATNVIPAPDMCLITQIGLDHMDVMGSDLRGIALEKAGIMKPGVPVFTYAQNDEITHVLEEQAHQLECPLCVITDEHNYDVGLLGAYQQQNARLAVAVARHLKISEAAITVGLKHARWPGRMQKVQYHGREVWLDMAHNASAAEQAVVSMRQMGLSPFHLVFSLRKTKDLQAFMHAFEGHTLSTTYIPLPVYAEGHTIEDVKDLCLDANIVEDVGTLGTLREGPVLVTGSAVLLGEVLEGVSINLQSGN